MPGVEVEHGAVAVAEVAQQPPQPLGSAQAPVGDHERARADSRPRGCGCELLPGGERVAPRGPGRGGEVALDVEERRTRDVRLEVGAPPEAGIVQCPAAVHEAVLHL